MADVEMAAEGDLLPGWTEHISPDGITYYYNASTGESRWERPAAQPPPALSSKRLLPVDETISKRGRLDSDLGDEAFGNGVHLLSTGRAGTESGAITSSPNRRRAALDERKVQLAEFLSTRDAIMDPNLPSILAEWVNTLQSLAELNNTEGNSISSAAQQAAKSLADGYAGFGDQATILGQWLDLTMDASTTDNDNGVDPTQPSSSLAWSVANARIKEAAMESRVAVRMLNQLLTKHENPPQWLLQLLSVKEWRSFFIDLAAKNPSSPLLNFCIRYMVEEGGHYEEVAQSVTAMTYFSVFSRSLADQLAKLVKLCQEQQTEATSGTMNRIVQLVENASSPHVAFYCAQMLFELERGEGLLSSESAKYIISHLRQRIQPLSTKLLHRGSLRVEFPSLADVLRKVVTGELDACEACVEIYTCYNPATVDSPAPPEWPLYERDFLDRLVAGLFRPSRKMEESVREKACWVLATAGLASQGTRTNNNAPVDTTTTTTPLDKKKQLMEALVKCSQICGDPETSGNLETRWTDDLRPSCEAHPTCSMGILFWARALLPHTEFLRSHAFAAGFLTMCKMTSFVAQKHPLQRPHVFGVLKRALDTRPPAGEEYGGAYLSDARLAELLESVIDAMVDLMGLGYVMPVLEHFIQQAPVLDLSLLRKFMFGILSIADAPYSRQFKEKLRGLLESTPGTKAGQGGGMEFNTLRIRFLEGKVKE